MTYDELRDAPFGTRVEVWGGPFNGVWVKLVDGDEAFLFGMWAHTTEGRLAHGSNLIDGKQVK